MPFGLSIISHYSKDVKLNLWSLIKSSLLFVKYQHASHLPLFLQFYCLKLSVSNKVQIVGLYTSEGYQVALVGPSFDLLSCHCKCFTVTRKDL